MSEAASKRNMSETEFFKFTDLKPVNNRNHSIVANEVNHFNRDEGYHHITWGNFRYFMTNSQYIVGNSDQVRVKYIVQMQKQKKSTSA